MNKRTGMIIKGHQDCTHHFNIDKFEAYLSQQRVNSFGWENNDQKKDRTLSKEYGLLIGRRLSGKSIFLKRSSEYKKQYLILAELEETFIYGHSTYLRVCRTIELKIRGGSKCIN